MNLIHRCFLFGALSVVSIGTSAQTAPASYPNFSTETPTSFQPVTSSWDYSRREVMIPMRDGVRLHTVILVPKERTDSADAYAL